MTRENGIGVGESKEDQLKKKLGEKFKRAAKGTVVTWKLSYKLVFSAFSDLDTKVYPIYSWSYISLNYHCHACKC